MTNATVKENLLLPFQLGKMDFNETMVNQLLDQVGLPKRILSKRTNDISGGQRQKISIARTLANEPEILLLDEITSSLDNVSQKGIESLIKQINQEHGTTILWIPHNLEQALNIGNDTWVMINGEVIETGPSKLLKDPKMEQVRHLVQGGQV